VISCQYLKHISILDWYYFLPYERFPTCRSWHGQVENLSYDLRSRLLRVLATWRLCDQKQWTQLRRRPCLNPLGEGKEQPPRASATSAKSVHNRADLVHFRAKSGSFSAILGKSSAERGGKAAPLLGSVLNHGCVPGTPRRSTGPAASRLEVAVIRSMRLATLAGPYRARYVGRMDSPKPTCRWHHLSLRTLFGAVTLFAILLASPHSVCAIDGCVSRARTGKAHNGVAGENGCDS